MNRFNTYTGGLPLKTDEITRLKEDMDRFMQCHYQQTATPQILWGCGKTGPTSIDEGVIIGPTGSLYYHPNTDYGASYSDAWYVDMATTQANQRVYADSTTHYVWDLDLATFVPTIVTWTSGTPMDYTDLDEARLDTKFYHLLNNVFSVYEGQIDCNNSYDMNLNYNSGTNIILGATSSQFTNVYTKMKHVSPDLTPVSHAGSIPYTLTSVNYDRIVYIRQTEILATETTISISGDVVGSVYGIGSFTVILPANATITVTPSNSTLILFHWHKFGIDF